MADKGNVIAPVPSLLENPVTDSKAFESPIYLSKGTIMSKTVLRNDIADEILGVPRLSSSYDYIFHLRGSDGWRHWDTNRDSGAFGIWSNDIALHLFVYEGSQRALYVAHDTRTYNELVEMLKETYPTSETASDLEVYAKGERTFTFMCSRPMVMITST